MLKRNPLRILFPLALIVGAAFLAINYREKIITFASDTFASLTYHPPAEVVALADKLDLTDEGRRIFYASRPEIETQDEFNKNCASYDTEVSTLGCYAGGKIHIYNVTDPEFSGIQESTAAHELMHAVWARAGDATRTELTTDISKVFNETDHHSDLVAELESYDEEETTDELHSRLATELADLPESLESHYAKYFKNQDAVVAFYDSYQGPFKKLDAEFDSLSAEIESLKSEIDSLQSSYEVGAEEYAKEVEEFNRCAETPNCFTESEFNSRRAELSSKRDELEDTYEELNSLVDEYNSKIDRYNNNILRRKTLDAKVNSNSKLEEL